MSFEASGAIGQHSLQFFSVCSSDAVSTPLKAFAEKAKAEGKSPEEIKVAVRKKYSKDLEGTKGVNEVIGGVTGMVTGGGGKGK